MEERGWSVTLVSQEPNSRVSSASLFSVHTPYFIFVSHLQMILPVLILINIGALSLIAVKKNYIDSLICSNARLHVLQRRSYLLLYKYRFTINKYGHRVLQIPLEILAFISERSGWFTSMIKFEMHRYMRNCIYGCSLPGVECSE